MFISVLISIYIPPLSAMSHFQTDNQSYTTYVYFILCILYMQSDTGVREQKA